MGRGFPRSVIISLGNQGGSDSKVFAIITGHLVSVLIYILSNQFSFQLGPLRLPCSFLISSAAGLITLSSVADIWQTGRGLMVELTRTELLS